VAVYLESETVFEGYCIHFYGYDGEHEYQPRKECPNGCANWGTCIDKADSDICAIAKDAAEPKNIGMYIVIGSLLLWTIWFVWSVWRHTLGRRWVDSIVREWRLNREEKERKAFYRKQMEAEEKEEARK